MAVSFYLHLSHIISLAKEIIWQCPFICLCLNLLPCMIAYKEVYPVKQEAKCNVCLCTWSYLEMHNHIMSLVRK
jgi:hypothetical protein